MKQRYDDLEIDQSIQKLSRIGRNTELERKTFEIIKKEATKKQSRLTLSSYILSPIFAAVLALVAIVSVGISNPNWLQGILSVGEQGETEAPNRTERKDSSEEIKKPIDQEETEETSNPIPEKIEKGQERINEIHMELVDFARENLEERGTYLSFMTKVDQLTYYLYAMNAGDEKRLEANYGGPYTFTTFDEQYSQYNHFVDFTTLILDNFLYDFNNGELSIHLKYEQRETGEIKSLHYFFSVDFQTEGMQDFSKFGIELVGKRYLQEQGYTVIYLSGREAYTLTEEMINTRPGTFKWSVQEFKPETYIGKLIEEEYYMITNHLFDSFQEETMVSIIIIDGEIMGGNAYIEIEPGIRGDHGFYSLDGTKKGE